MDRERRTAAYIAELVGTFLLVLFIALILSVTLGFLNFKDFVLIGVVHGLVLMMLIQTVGGLSGAHFNPAVTVAVAAIRKITPIDAAIYICMQLAGGLLAALVCKLIIHDAGATVHYGAPMVSDALHGKAFTGMLVEAIGTFVLMWAIMGMAVNPRGARDWAGPAIGATLAFLVMTFGALTGAGLNPARSLGPSVVGGGEGVGRFLLIYVLGPLVGALIAAFGYRQLVLVPQERLPGERPVDKLA
jgi:MIP family channel proteins